VVYWVKSGKHGDITSRFYVSDKNNTLIEYTVMFVAIIRLLINMCIRNKVGPEKTKQQLTI
jgi:hypothetical protein